MLMRKRTSSFARSFPVDDRNGCRQIMLTPTARSASRYAATPEKQRHAIANAGLDLWARRQRQAAEHGSAPRRVGDHAEQHAGGFFGIVERDQPAPLLG